MSAPGEVQYVHDRAEQETAPGVVLTPAAIEKVQTLLEREGRNHPKDLRLRVAVQPGGCAGLRYELYFDERLFDADHVIRYGNVPATPTDPTTTGPGHSALSPEPAVEVGYDSGYESGDDDAHDPSQAEAREPLPQGQSETLPGFEVVIDPRSLPELRGATIDFQDTLQKTGFVIDNPNAQSGCACGDSFC